MAITETDKRNATIIEAVRQSLIDAGHFNAGDAVAPAAILWADPDAEWTPLVQRLRTLMPELLTLGEYSPDQKTGPAIWLRCVIEGSLAEPKMPEKTIPIIYMPNVSRQTLRSPEDCPDFLSPLVELQYRGAVWTQVNGKDWTVEAFLVSENGGLGLDVARDQKTRQAMLGALEALATTPIAALRGRKLEAEDFDKLMIGDTIRDLLVWISAPTGTRAEWDHSHWSAFCSRCKDEYQFDPESDGEIVAAERLGLRQERWLGVWQRFTESPALYPGVPSMLTKAKPRTLLFDREPWPDENQKDEDVLRKDILALGSVAPAEARSRVLKLEEQHSQRRAWVWARMGLSPLAGALQHLVTLAERTALVIGGDTPDVFADAYVKGAWQADDAVLRAVAAVKSAEDQQAINSAVRCVYLPWLEDSARNFQNAIEKRPLPDSSGLGDAVVTADTGMSIVFVDGLRFDVAQRLLAKAHERQLQCGEGYRWAAFPTVTPTAKPAVSPVAAAISDGTAGQDFYPVVTATGKPVNADQLHELLTQSGYQVLRGLDTGQPNRDEAKAWTESGEFDALGHKLQTKLASRVDEQLDLVLERIISLLEAGWRSVRVVTDHGWLLVPGALPSLPLQKYLVECRWARCAVFKEGARADVPSARWFWDPDQLFAYAPGVHCFGATNEYAHGGLSLQECIVPDLTFRLESGDKDVRVSIASVQWLGLRCRVVIEPPAAGLTADLRTKANDPRSSVAAPKAFDHEGRAGLLVEDDSLAGTSVNLVVLNAHGHVISKYPTTVGGDV